MVKKWDLNRRKWKMKFEIKDWEPKKIPEKYHKKVKWMVIYIDHGVPTRIWGEKIKNKKKNFLEIKNAIVDTSKVTKHYSIPMRTTYPKIFLKTDSFLIVPVRKEKIQKKNIFSKIKKILKKNFEKKEGE